MWTKQIVRERFIEAAEIERRMYVKGHGGGGNAWPAYEFDNEDRAGWVQEDIDEAKDLWARNQTTRAPEIARWQEVYFEWTLNLIASPSDRRRAWAWARCLATGLSFVALCEKKGLVRRTEYARLERTFCNLAEILSNNKWPLREAETQGLAQVTAISHNEPARVELRARKDGPQVHRPFRTEKHHDNLTTPDAIEAFQQHVSDHNDRMRRRRERSMRGVPVAA